MFDLKTPYRTYFKEMPFSVLLPYCEKRAGKELNIETIYTDCPEHISFEDEEGKGNEIIFPYAWIKKIISKHFKISVGKIIDYGFLENNLRIEFKEFL